MCTLGELYKIGAVARVDFGRGILDEDGSPVGPEIIDRKVAKRIQYIFAAGKTNSKIAKDDVSNHS